MPRKATITTGDQGAAYAGSTGGSIFTSNTGFELQSAGGNLIHGLTFTGSTGIYAHGDGTTNSVSNTFEASTFLGNSCAIDILNGTFDAIVNNTISGSGTYGVYLPSEGTATVTGNTISGKTYGVYGTGNLSITSNNISQSDYGVFVGSGTSTVSLNAVSNNQTGIYSYSGSTQVFGNTVFANVTGIEGYGTLGGTDWASANDVYNNTATGIRAYGGDTVQFNKIHGNPLGVLVSNGGTVVIQNNLIYGSSGRGILVDNASGVTIESNTVRFSAGEPVWLQNHTANVGLRNNILWTDSGYDLYVATDSQVGFSSDYNNLYTANPGDPGATPGTAALVWWQKAFVDLVDWQFEADYDNHSLGYTTLNPTLDDPKFTGDYRLDAGSTSIDAGDPASPFTVEPPPYNGGRIDLGAYGNTSLASQSSGSYLRIEYPTYYTDWEASVGNHILWHAYGLSGAVSIDLYYAEGGFVKNLGTAPAADGLFDWSPSMSDIAGDANARYRITITSVGNPSISTTSREGFSVPPSTPTSPLGGQTYYVNTPDNAAHRVYTTGLGDNRHTGKTPGDPKASLLGILRSYKNIGPTDYVYLDPGNYVHARNVIISGNPAAGHGGRRVVHRRCLYGPGHRNQVHADDRPRQHQPRLNEYRAERGRLRHATEPRPGRGPDGPLGPQREHELRRDQPHPLQQCRGWHPR